MLDIKCQSLQPDAPVGATSHPRGGVTTPREREGPGGVFAGINMSLIEFRVGELAAHFWVKAVRRACSSPGRGNAPSPARVKPIVPRRRSWDVHLEDRGSIEQTPRLGLHGSSGIVLPMIRQGESLDNLDIDARIRWSAGAFCESETGRMNVGRIFQSSRYQSLC
jgi:hypothetical protein